LRPEFYTAVCTLANTGAFMAFDACDSREAQRLYTFALRCAEEAGDWQRRAAVLVDMAREAWWPVSRTAWLPSSLAVTVISARAPSGVDSTTAWVVGRVAAAVGFEERYRSVRTHHEVRRRVLRRRAGHTNGPGDQRMSSA